MPAITVQSGTSRKKLWMWILAGVGIILLIVILYFVFRPKPQPAATAAGGNSSPPALLTIGAPQPSSGLFGSNSGGLLNSATHLLGMGGGPLGLITGQGFFPGGGLNPLNTLQHSLFHI